MKYDIIYADPPWRNPKSGTNARNNEKHYPSMSTEEICNLPVKEIGTDRSILWIWCVFPNLPDVFRVMEAWGYEYYGDIRTVDVTVRRIREKIEKDTSAPKILITKRGVGYYIATGEEN